MMHGILHNITEYQIKELFNIFFTDQSFEIKKIQPLTGGVLNFVTKVDIIIDSSTERSFVIKTYSGKQLDPTAVATRKEIYNLQELSAQFSGPVPKVYMFDDTNKDTREVMDFIQGSSLEKVDEHRAIELGVTIARFHKSLQSFPGFKKKVIDTRILFEEITESFRRALTTTSVSSELRYLNKLGRYAFKVLLLYPNSAKLPGGIIHGDLHGGNIIVDKTGKLFLLDFELCREDKFIKDIANAICMFCMRKDEKDISKVIFDLTLVDKILTGYNSIRALTKDEIEYLPFALRDRADLEMIANMKLFLNRKNAGSPFDKSCAQALNETLSSRAWSEFYAQLLNSFSPPPLISAHLPRKASLMMHNPRISHDPHKTTVYGQIKHRESVGDYLFRETYIQNRKTI